MMPYRVILPRRKPPVLLPLSPARPAVAGVLDLAKKARTMAQYLASTVRTDTGTARR